MFFIFNAQNKPAERTEVVVAASKTLQSTEAQRTTSSKVSTSRLPDTVAEGRPSSSAATTQPSSRLVDDIANGYR